jgi:2'-5' RNA ligase
MLADFESVRTTPTLVLKRFDGSLSAHAIESEIRLALADSSPFAVRLEGIGTFKDPVAGAGPVVYLAVESPGLEGLHTQLVDRFGAHEGLEGDDYVPHVTLARGSGMHGVAPLEDAAIDPLEWTVSELWFWDARLQERTARLALSS